MSIQFFLGYLEIYADCRTLDGLVYSNVYVFTLEVLVKLCDLYS